MATTKTSWGFDLSDLNTSVRPQDDFFHYVNGGWLKKNEIPVSESRWGSFIQLRYKTDKQLKGILLDLEKVRSAKPGSAEQIIRDFRRSGMDMKRRNKLGIAPLLPFLKKIENITSIEQMLDALAELDRHSVVGLWSAGIDQDSKNSDRYILHFGQGGLGMPDRDYYLKNDAESKRVREAYVQHVEKLSRLMGSSSAEAKRTAAVIMGIETQFARASMKKEDRRDPEKIYHKMTVAKFIKLTPSIPWRRYLDRNDAAHVNEVIVMQPDFFAAVSRLLNEVSLEDWKTYLSWHVVNNWASALSTKFITQSFSFYGTVLTGTKVIRPLWRRVLATVNCNVGELLGQIYVQKHFPPEAKKRMDVLVDDLFTVYEKRLKNLDWMSSATKKKALLKLKALNRKIGYPTKWKSYRGLVIKSDDYVGNIMRTNVFEHKRAMKKLKGPIDRAEWFMYPQTVNAYFAPNMNDIVFPAAILQPPFFNMRADDALNYGCIGTVIGHEITHGFDDEGSKFDAKGNLKSWWTKEDRARFERKAEILRKQFDQYTVADGIKVNGKLTLGENIADLGGLSIAYDAYQLQLERTGRKDIGGYTPEQRFFMGFALFEQEKVRPEFEKMQVLTDPHSPGKFRINGPASNIDEFYKAFGVKKGDKLYRSPAQRANIW
jgi:putative endopeptidase